MSFEPQVLILMSFGPQVLILMSFGPQAPILISFGPKALILIRYKSAKEAKIEHYFIAVTFVIFRSNEIRLTL